MTSMIVLKVVNAPWLRAVCSPQLFQVLMSAGLTNSNLVNMNPSLHRMNEALKSRLATTLNPFEGRTLLVSSVDDSNLVQMIQVS